MATGEWLADQFEEHRAHLRTVAYRMLGSASEAEDAVQETWIRLGRADVGDIASLRGWLTTVVARVCLDMLRARTSRREDPLDVHLPDPIITRGEWEPESDAMLADSVGFAITLGSALIAHLSVGDGPEAWGWAAGTGVLWGLSYFFWRRLQATPVLG